MQLTYGALLCLSVLAPVNSIAAATDDNIVNYDGKEIYYGGHHDQSEPHFLRHQKMHTTSWGVADTKRHHMLNVHIQEPKEAEKADEEDDTAEKADDEEKAEEKKDEKDDKAEDAKDETAKKPDAAKTKKDNDDKAKKADDNKSDKAEGVKDAEEVEQSDEENAEEAEKSAEKEAADAEKAEKKAAEEKAVAKKEAAKKKKAAKKAAKKKAKAAKKAAKKAEKKKKAAAKKAREEKAAAGALKGMTEENGAPSQGFRGEIVEHNDGVTMTHDWQSEYGPGNKDWQAVCQGANQKNTWCKYYLRKQQHKSAASMHTWSVALLIAIASLRLA